MIVRTRRSADPFARVSKTILSDNRLSWRAKGIIAYLMGKPDDWTVVMEDVTKQSTEGRDAVKAAFTELKECGYAELIVLKGDDGKLAGKVWIIRDTPHRSTENPSVGTDQLENRLSGKPSVGESATTKNDLTKIDFTKTDSGNSPKVVTQQPLRKKRESIARFTPPTLQECRDEARKLGMPTDEGDAFWNHHDAKDWFMSRGVKMKRWKSAMGTWHGYFKKRVPVNGKKGMEGLSSTSNKGMMGFFGIGS